MDRAPADAEAAARAAIAGIEPPVSLSRLRLRQAAGRTFADVVISVSPGAAVGQGHAVADLVEAELEAGAARAATSSSTSSRWPTRRRSATALLAAAMTVPRVREIHNLSVVSLGGADRGLAPPEAARRPAARRGPRDRGAGRAGDRRLRSRDRVGADPPRAARRGGGRRARRGGRDRGRGRARRRRPSARAAAPPDGEGRRRLPHARARPGLDACRGPLVGERGRGAAAPRETRCRRRDRAHRAA